MPCQYDIFHEQKFVLIRLWGKIQINDILDMHKLYAANPVAERDYVEFADLGDVLKIDLNFSQIGAIITSREKIVSPDHAPNRAAIYAPTDVCYGMARMYQSIGDGRISTEIQVFATDLECLRYLNREEQTMAELRKSLFGA